MENFSRRLLALPFLLVLVTLVLTLWTVTPPVACAVSSKYQIILKKNPFDPERGAGNEQENGRNAPSEAEEFAKNHAVYGVVIAGGNRFAFIKEVSKAGSRKRSRDRSQDDIRKVTVGDLVSGWKVSDIRDEGVSFVSAGKRVFLKVFGTTKNERTSNEPVAIATPKPRVFIPPPVPARSISGKNGHRQRPQIFVFPNGKNGQKINNPFLKALMEARKKSLRQKNNKGR